MQRSAARTTDRNLLFRAAAYTERCAGEGELVFGGLGGGSCQAHAWRRIFSTTLRSPTTVITRIGFWHPSQQMRPRRDGTLELRLETSSRRELTRWILSWMPHIRVLAPRQLQDRVRQRLREAKLGARNPKGKSRGAGRRVKADAEGRQAESPNE